MINHTKFIKIIHPSNGYRPIGCDIDRRYVARDEHPTHRLERRGRSLDFLPNVGDDMIAQGRHDDN